MRIFAHRGFHTQGAIENTLPAFEQACQLGVDGIETDLRLSSDGIVVLIHNRCAPDGTPVSCLTHADLQHRLGYDVPRLEEVLDRVWPICWNLEIKTADVLAVAIPIIAQSPHRDFLLSSFVHDVCIAAVDALDFPGAYLAAHRPASDDDLPQRRHFLDAIVWDYEIASSDLLDRCARLGRTTIVYGATAKSEHIGLLNTECSAIITDYPEYLL